MSDEKRPGSSSGSDSEKAAPIDRPRSAEVTPDDSREPTAVFEPDALEAKAIQGPLRRNAPLLLAVLVVLLVGPALSRVLSSYRAVVLEIDAGRMLLIEGRIPPPPPRWVDAVGAKPGAIVDKSVGTWNPIVVEVTPDDRSLMEYHERWASEYTGTITEIRPPHAPGGASVAVVALEDGSTLDVPLWSQDLAEAAPGKLLRKRSGSWEPELFPGR